MEYISLGANCSVTYQLDKLNLRKKAYPFDWCKISINQLIKVLENNFNNYSNVEIRELSFNYQSFTEPYSYLLVNNYNITFAHEIVNINNTFRDKLERRINRFRESKNNIYIRIELSKITNNYYNKVIRLCELLDKYSDNYILILILNTDIDFCFSDNVKVYKYNNFSQDWKMSDLEWDKYFMIK